MEDGGGHTEVTAGDMEVTGGHMRSLQRARVEAGLLRAPLVGLASKRAHRAGPNRILNALPVTGAAEDYQPVFDLMNVTISAAVS